MQSVCVHARFTPLYPRPHTEHADFVNAEIKMLNWKYMDFKIVLRSTTTLKQIATMIEARHGKMADLRMFTSPPSLKSEITNLGMRLADLGYKGGAREHPENCVLFYDYKAEVGEPLLSFSNQT